MEPYADVPAAYREFARSADDSPCFAAWADAVAQDAELVAWLERLPPLKRQPNLVFAAARHHGVAAPGPYAALREALLADTGAIRHTIATRATQTNEVGRLATLVPALAALAAGRPLTLVEAGASAGLCLHPDRWGYRWRTASGPITADPPGHPASGPRLECDVEGPAPLPSAPPAVAARHGLDLNPLDVTDPETLDWLTTLVWPEHDERRARLRAAAEVARSDPPRLERGDLLRDLPGLVERAAARATGPVVVFHSAVVAYLQPDDRVRFDALMRDLVARGRCHWVSNEGARVLPSVTGTGPEPPEGSTDFVLGVDGRAVAWTQPHGRRLHWFGDL